MLKLQITLAAAALALLGTAAQAQVAGTYNGTTSDGLQMQITIADDGNGGLVFTGDSFQWNMTCNNGASYFGWWGVGQYAPVTGRTLTAESKLGFLYEKVFMKFSLDSQTVTGNFVGDQATYIDLDVNKKTQNCAGAKVTFSGTLNGPVAAHAVAVPAGARMQHVD